MPKSAIVVPLSANFSEGARTAFQEASRHHLHRAARYEGSESVTEVPFSDAADHAGRRAEVSGRGHGW